MTKKNENQKPKNQKTKKPKKKQKTKTNKKQNVKQGIQIKRYKKKIYKKKHKKKVEKLVIEIVVRFVFFFFSLKKANEKAAHHSQSSLLRANKSVKMEIKFFTPPNSKKSFVKFLTETLKSMLMSSLVASNRD